MTEHSKTEHAAVHEPVPLNDTPQLNAGGEDVGFTVDRTHSAAPLRQALHGSILSKIATTPRLINLM